MATFTLQETLTKKYQRFIMLGTTSGTLQNNVMKKGLYLEERVDKENNDSLPSSCLRWYAVFGLNKYQYELLDERVVVVEHLITENLSNISSRNKSVLKLSSCVNKLLYISLNISYFFQCYCTSCVFLLVLDFIC